MLKRPPAGTFSFLRMSRQKPHFQWPVPSDGCRPMAEKVFSGHRIRIDLKTVFYFSSSPIGNFSKPGERSKENPFFNRDNPSPHL
jgi:hypothetical protein